MRIQNGRIEYPTVRCPHCTLVVLYAPGVCDECIRHGAKPPVVLDSRCWAPNAHPATCRCMDTGHMG